MSNLENETILNQYKIIVDMIGLFFKDSVEVVLHSLRDLDRSVVYIHNGKKTNRTMGSPVTDKALRVISEYKATRKRLFGPYKTISCDGHAMKSVTTVIVNHSNEAIGLLCVNLDLETPVQELFNIMCADFEQSPEHSSNDNEYFATDTSDLLNALVNQIKNEVQNDNSVPHRQKTRAIVVELQKQGLFNLRNAIPVISEILNLSKASIYLHLRAIKNNEAGDEDKD